MTRINRFADLRSVFLPNDPSYQAPSDFGPGVMLTQDWAGGGIALNLAEQFFKRYSVGPLAGGSQVIALETVPTDKCYRILSAGAYANPNVGPVKSQLGAYSVGTTYVPITQQKTSAAGSVWGMYELSPNVIIPGGAGLYVSIDAAAANDILQIALLIIAAPMGLGFTF